MYFVPWFKVTLDLGEVCNQSILLCINMLSKFDGAIFGKVLHIICFLCLVAVLSRCNLECFVNRCGYH